MFCPGVTVRRLNQLSEKKLSSMSLSNQHCASEIGATFHSKTSAKSGTSCSGVGVWRKIWTIRKSGWKEIRMLQETGFTSRTPIRFKNITTGTMQSWLTIVHYKNSKHIRGTPVMFSSWLIKSGEHSVFTGHHVQLTFAAKCNGVRLDFSVHTLTSASKLVIR